MRSFRHARSSTRQTPTSPSHLRSKTTACAADKPSVQAGRAEASPKSRVHARSAPTLGVPMRIEGSEFGSAPVDDPRCYPGQIPGYSYLLVEDAVYPLEAGSPGSPLEALGASLLRLGVAPLEHRHPVLFY